MSAPRLAYVVNALHPGGTEKLVFEMSLAYAKDFDVLVVCLDDPGSWGRDLRARGIRVECVWRQPGLDLSMPRKLAALFRAHGTQLVHAHQCTPWFYSALSRLFHSAPKLVLEEHGRFYPEVTNRPRAFVNRMLIRRLTHEFVAVSEDIRSRLQQYEGLDARQVQVIYNGIVPFSRLEGAGRSALRRQLGLADADFVAGTVGRFDPIKNLPMLVAALAEARRRVPSVRGLLVGDGPEMPRVRELLRQEGLEDSVVLTGYRSDARDLVQCMDLFILPSFSEGTSMALLEAMYSGTAAAVTRVGGNPEIVEAGVSGWVVESGAASQLAAAIVEAAEHPDRRQRMAGNAQRKVAERFTFDRMIGAYADLYRRLLAGDARSQHNLGAP
jgi:glycosyltransferase involved in cell wall biosynthesis